MTANKNRIRIIIFAALTISLAACQTSTPIVSTPTVTASPVAMIEPVAPSEPTLSAPTPVFINTLDSPELEATSVPKTQPLLPPTQQPTLAPDEWKTLPVLPELSPYALAILHEGIANGNNPHVFSKIGDCESQTDLFLDPFDKGPQYYNLGQFEDTLSPVLAYYKGSFARKSLAAGRGFTAASLLSPIWADHDHCDIKESPLACELRTNNPSVAIIMLGTNDASNPVVFEHRLREVIEYTLSMGVLPILGTKADNLEGDHSINYMIASLAKEYELPLWNFWAAVQPLPCHGLVEDGAHLTYAGPFFDTSLSLRRAWSVRNLNALQVLLKVIESSGQ